MKKIIFLLLIFITFIIYSEKIEFSYKFGQVTNIMTRANVMTYVNGERVGDRTYREMSTMKLDEVSEGIAYFKGITYNTEKIKFLNDEEYRVTDAYKYDFSKSKNGEFKNYKRGFNNFPVFPDEEVSIGEVWGAPAVLKTPLFNKAIDSVNINMQVTYRLGSIEESDKGKIATIIANAVAVKDRNSDFVRDAKLFKFAGFYNFLIKFNITKGQVEYIEEVFDYFYVLYDEYVVIESSGTSKSNYKNNRMPDIKKLNSLFGSDDVKVILNKEGNLSITLENIKFKADSAVLIESETKRIDQIAEVFLSGFSNYYMIVVGHTADIGDKTKQLSLSKKRANTVYDYLIKKHNFSSEIISFFGKGGTSPVASNKNEDGRKKNRRVEFIIIEK